MRIRALQGAAGALLIAAGFLVLPSSAARAQGKPGEPRPAAQKTRGADAELRAPGAFTNIADPAQRSAALFVEAGKVLLHPRCVNCHPAGDRPIQGDGRRPARALGATRPGRLRSARPAVFDVPSGRELRRRPHARSSEVASRAGGHGVGGPHPRADLRADQGSGAERRARPEAHRRTHGARLARRVGLDARSRPPTRARDPGGVRRTDQGVGRYGRGVSGSVIAEPPRQ